MAALTGKRALVTGGATGIGWGIAEALAAAGCHVAIAGRREDKLKEAAAAWRGDLKMLTHAVDVTDPHALERSLGKAKRIDDQRRLS